jgi:O-antigen/teichoic acid export membrane protein
MTGIWDKIKGKKLGSHGITKIGITDLSGSIIAAIFWFYIATLVGAEHYGHISYFLATANFVSSISLVGATNTLYVYRAKEVKIRAPIYFISLVFVAISSTILFFIFNNIAISIMAIGYVIFNLSISELLGSKSYSHYSAYVITQKILMIGLALGLYYWIGIEGIILGIGLSFLPYVTRLYKGFREEKLDFSIIKQRGGFIINSYFLELSNGFINSIDRLIIAPLLGFVILGNYQLAMQFLAVLYMLPGAFYKYTVSHEASGSATTNIKKSAIILSTIAAIVVIIASPFFLPIFFPKFNQTIQALQILSLVIIPYTVNLTLISKFFSLEKSRIVLLSSTTYIGVQVIAIVILGRLYGINGVAVALILAELVQMTYLISVKKFAKI